MGLGPTRGRMACGPPHTLSYPKADLPIRRVACIGTQMTIRRGLIALEGLPFASL
jgi:hypothetical protein